MSVHARLSHLSVQGLLLACALLFPASFTESETIYIKPKQTKVTTVQPKITGNYEQLIDIQRDALNQAVIKARAATAEMQKIRSAIKQYEAEAELKKQEAAQAQPVPASAEPEGSGPLRSLEEGEQEAVQ